MTREDLGQDLKSPAEGLKADLNASLCGEVGKMYEGTSCASESNGTVSGYEYIEIPGNRPSRRPEYPA